MAVTGHTLALSQASWLACSSSLLNIRPITVQIAYATCITSPSSVAESLSPPFVVFILVLYPNWDYRRASMATSVRDWIPMAIEDL